MEFRKKNIYHGIRPFTVGGGTLMELGRRNFIMGYDPLRWGGTLMELGRRNFIMGYDPLGWGGDTHGIRKKKISWDTTLYGGGGIPGIRKKKFYHGHERGWLWGSPQYREARVGERG